MVHLHADIFAVSAKRPRIDPGQDHRAGLVGGDLAGKARRVGRAHHHLRVAGRIDHHRRDRIAPVGAGGDRLLGDIRRQPHADPVARDHVPRAIGMLLGLSTDSSQHEHWHQRSTNGHSPRGKTSAMVGNNTWVSA